VLEGASESVRSGRLPDERPLEIPMSLLTPGVRAPEFSLPSTPDRRVALSDLRGRRVVLAFYPADWSPVCGDQLAVYNRVLPMFEERNAALLAVSVDGVWCHQAFTDARSLRFPLLADFEPKGAVARQYGAYRDADGIAERALFVVDEDGVIRWSYLSPIGVNPGADGIFDALDALSGAR
jgi:peroxiredoxin